MDEELEGQPVASLSQFKLNNEEIFNFLFPRKLSCLFDSREVILKILDEVIKATYKTFETPEPSVVYTSEPSSVFSSLLESRTSDMYTSQSSTTYSSTPEKSASDELLKRESPMGKTDLTIFIRQIISAMADDISLGNVQYLHHDELYYWTNYFFLQYCGLILFESNLDVMVEKMETVEAVADLIIGIIDDVAENYEYLNPETDVPERFAKTILWQIIKSNIDVPPEPRYSYEIVTEVLEDLLIEVNTIGRIPSDIVALKSKPIVEEKEEDRIDAACNDYLGVFVVAESFVDALLIEATGYYTQYNNKEQLCDDLLNIDCVLERVNTSLRMKHKSLEDIVLLQYYIKPKYGPHHKVVHTPTISQFTIKAGHNYINNYIETWSYEESWTYIINFLMAQSDAVSDYYFYEVVWSLPTQLYPIAQATASVYFTIEVSRVKPPQCPVNMTYKFEGNGFPHDPFENEFCEQSLFNILESKINLFKTLQF